MVADLVVYKSRTQCTLSGGKQVEGLGVRENDIKDSGYKVERGTANAFNMSGSLCFYHAKRGTAVAYHISVSLCICIVICRSKDDNNYRLFEKNQIRLSLVRVIPEPRTSQEVYHRMIWVTRPRDLCSTIK